MKRLLAGVFALVLVALTAPALAAAAGDEEGDCSSLDVRDLLGGDLTGLSDDDLLARLGQVMTGAGPLLHQAGVDALNGTDDDIRAFFETGWELPYGHDLRIRVGQIMSASGPEVRAAANEALDAGTLEALEDFLIDQDCQPTPPESTTTTTPTGLAPATPDPAGSAGSEQIRPAPAPENAPAAVPAPATPVRAQPRFTG